MSNGKHKEIKVVGLFQTKLFLFASMKTHLKWWKMLFISSKKLFASQDI